MSTHFFFSGGEGGGGVAYSFVGCLLHVTARHASLSRWSTVPTLKGHLKHLEGALIFFFLGGGGERGGVVVAEMSCAVRAVCR